MKCGTTLRLRFTTRATVVGNHAVAPRAVGTLLAWQLSLHGEGKLGRPQAIPLNEACEVWQDFLSHDAIHPGKGMAGNPQTWSRGFQRYAEHQLGILVVLRTCIDAYPTYYFARIERAKKLWNIGNRHGQAERQERGDRLKRVAEAQAREKLLNEALKTFQDEVRMLGFQGQARHLAERRYALKVEEITGVKKIKERAEADYLRRQGYSIETAQEKRGETTVGPNIKPATSPHDSQNMNNPYRFPAGTNWGVRIESDRRPLR